MLRLVEEGIPGPLPSSDPRVQALVAALDKERKLVGELADVLARQRAAVAQDDPDAVDDSVQALGRVMLVLDEARRHRIALVGDVAGDPELSLTMLERRLGNPLPPELNEARRQLRSAAEACAREVRVNQNVLRRALEVGDAYLQTLFSGGHDPAPTYVPGPPKPPEARQGLLLNRTA